MSVSTLTDPYRLPAASGAQVPHRVFMRGMRQSLTDIPIRGSRVATISGMRSRK